MRHDPDRHRARNCIALWEHFRGRSSKPDRQTVGYCIHTRFAPQHDANACFHSYSSSPPKKDARSSPRRVHVYWLWTMICTGVATRSQIPSCARTFPKRENGGLGIANEYRKGCSQRRSREKLARRNLVQERRGGASRIVLRAVRVGSFY